ncbi:MAG: hypothetical protein ACRBB3_03075 [Alphaproteobacteria bacterium]
MNNPDDLHKLVMADIRKYQDVDENGFTSDINGTSFSAPEQAGYVSGAMYEQEVRESKNLPILTKEEISSLVKLSTTDVSLREGEDNRMNVFNNKAGFDFSYASMHGVFRPEMFRELLDEAYKKIETDPDINRDTVTAVMSADIDNQKGSEPLEIKFDKSVKGNIVVDRSRFDMDFKVNGSIPGVVEIGPADEPVGYSRLQISSNHSDFTAWSRREVNFGETIGRDDTWRVRVLNGHDSKLSSVSMTVYGYNEGGLIDQMMDHAKLIEPKHDFDAQPENDAPAVPDEASAVVETPAMAGASAHIQQRMP